MFILRKSLIAISALLFILACQAIGNPIQQAQNMAGTASVLGTEIVEQVTQVSEYAPNIPPMETTLPIPSAFPNIPENIFEPQSPPLSEWNGIPVMEQASAGDESDGMYVYRIAATSEEVQDFYKTKLPDLGWESSFSIPMAGTALMIYTRDNQVLSITILPTEGSDLIVMITLE